MNFGLLEAIVVTVGGVDTYYDYDERCWKYRRLGGGPVHAKPAHDKPVNDQPGPAPVELTPDETPRHSRAARRDKRPAPAAR
jgi:hypothetical protein